jgi:hypothetical protein
MRKSQILLSLALLACFCTTGFAADSEDLAKENAQLRQKLNQIDQELQSLKKTYMDQSGETTDIIPKMVWSNLDIQLYGYLKLDAAYDTSRTDNGDYTKWVESEATNDDDDQFNMTANETRLGMLINGPDDGQMKTSGRVELDFFGPGDGIAENQGRLMMRHAYMMLDWPDSRFNIIAGQTSDVISPLYPRTVNYSVGWWVGNIGYRRPQIRLTKELGFVDGGCLKLEGAVARTIGRDNPSLAGITDSGEDNGFPTLQGRASFTFDETTIGLSTHWGEEEYDITSSGSGKDFNTWSVNLDYSQPIREKVELKAEVFTGENLDAYLGGIGQGVTIDTPPGINQYDEVGSKGGWIAASLGPWGTKRFNVGLAMDDVDRDDVNYGDRILNRCIFGNVYCAVNKHTDVAFELSHWRTEYRGSGDGESLRAQMAMIYKF